MKLISLIGALVCLESPLLHAQLESGAILGTVTDPSQAVIPGAKVTLTNEETGFTVSTTTAEGGTYAFTPIKIGTYTVTAEFRGFETSVRPHITVNVQQQVVVDFSLRPGLETQTVEVTSAVPLLQVQNASVGQVVGDKQINDLPLNGRNFTFLAQLAAGVTQMQQDSRGFGASGGFSANGVRSESNNYLLDGIDNNNDSQDFLNGTFYVALPPVDAIAEFKVETANYSAEFGRAGGAALNATLKSGTNQFHGDLWEFLRNDKLDAADFFTNAAGLQKGEFRQNQFGFTAGGPIRKNKTFIFGDYQGTRVRQALVDRGTVPTVLMRSSGYNDFSDLFSQSTGAVTDPLGRSFRVGQIFDPATTRPVTAGQVDPVTGLTAASTGFVRDPFPGNLICPTTPCGRIDQNAVKLLNLYPLPNLPGLFNNYASAPIQSLTGDSFDVRADQNFSERDQMFGRMSYTRTPRFIPGVFPGLADGGSFNAGNQTVGTRNAALSETHSFTPTTINSLRFSFGRVHTLFAPTTLNQLGIPAQFGIQGIPQVPLNGGLPQFSVTGLSPFGQSTYTPINEWDDTWELADSLTKVYQSHTFKVGFEGIYLRFATYQPADPRGADTFSGVYTSIPGVNVNNSGAVQFVLNPTTASVPAGVDYNGGPNSVAISRISITDARRKYYGGYFQDDWKVTPKLTLNLGIRWEYFPAIYEEHDAQSNFIQGTPFVNAAYLIPKSRSNQSDPNNALSASFLSLLQKDGISLQYVDNRGLRNAQKDNFAPRFGFAYRVTSKLVVRGGYGISYNGLEGVGYGPALGATYPFAFTAGFSNNSNQSPIVFPNGQNATLENAYANISLDSSVVNGSAVTLRGIEKNLKTAYVQSSNLTFQYQLSTNTSFQVAYVGTFGRHIEANAGSANVVHELLVPSANAAPFREYPDMAPGGSIQSNWGSMYYYGLQTNLEHQFAHGLSFLTNYTWSRCRTDAADQLNGTAIGYRAPGLGPQIDYGPCDSDIRQVFHFSGGYDLPFGKGKPFLSATRGAISQLVGGWRINSILTLEDGQPFTIPCDITTASGMSCVALLVPGQNIIGGQHNVNQWMNPAAFANPGVVTTNGQTDLSPLGGARGQVYGPGFHRLDFSLFKEFQPTEKTRLEFRTEFFNLTNHPNFSTPLGPTGGSAVVSAPGALDFKSANFGRITATRDTPNDPRQIQFGLKFYW
ncbi:MAG TPA: TonB-dependent receptor [Bryobacteraceae bacterium]|nr:TonB-dependent receptor [Bryobacteraceae bacterium]